MWVKGITETYNNFEHYVNLDKASHLFVTNQQTGVTGGNYALVSGMINQSTNLSLGTYSSQSAAKAALADLVDEVGGWVLSDNEEHAVNLSQAYQMVVVPAGQYSDKFGVSITVPDGAITNGQYTTEAEADEVLRDLIIKRNLL